jgi:hypothetical protein
MMRFGITAVGLCVPGIPDWPSGQALLQGKGQYDSASAMPDLRPGLLPANERRRTTPHIKLALQVAQEAVDAWQGHLEDLSTVFCSSDADLEIVDKILTSLNLPGSPVSPTHFHNSVHNAPAGYWSIATGSHAPSTSLSAHEASFSVGLLEAACQVSLGNHPVLLVAYDMPPPATLSPFCPVDVPFGLALLLAPVGDPAAIVEVGLELLHKDDIQNTMDDAGLEGLRKSAPAARGLPLLAMLARGGSGPLEIPALPGQVLKLELSPC